MRKQIFLWLLLALCLCLPPAQAARLTVNWSPEIYTVGGTEADNWLDLGAREKITRALTQRLHALQAEGRLPFDLRESVRDYALDAAELGPVLGIVPVALVGTSVDTVYHVEDETYYRSIILSGLSLFVCSVDEDYDTAGRAQVSYRVLGMLPLYSYTVLGGDLDALRTAPVTEAEKAEQYAAATVEVINKYMDFSGQKNILKNLNTRQMFSDELYQVTDVAMTAPLLQRLYGSAEADSLRAGVAYFFTGAYQQRTKRLMLPPAVGAAALHDDVVDNLYSLSLDSQSGHVSLTMPRPKQAIRLDLCGAACGPVRTARQLPQEAWMGYQIWLAQRPGEDGPQDKMTLKDARALPTGGTATIERDDRDVFAALAVELALQMGARKK